MAVVDDNGAVACNCGKFGEEASAFGVGLGCFEEGEDPPTGGAENWMSAASIILAELCTIPCGSCTLPVAELSDIPIGGCNLAILGKCWSG